MASYLNTNNNIDFKKQEAVFSGRFFLRQGMMPGGLVLSKDNKYFYKLPTLIFFWQ